LVVFCGAAAKTSLLIQKVFDCKWYKALNLLFRLFAFLLAFFGFGFLLALIGAF
jgi:hypothetical protein